MKSQRIKLKRIKGKLLWDTGKEFLINPYENDLVSKNYQRIKYSDVYKVTYVETGEG